MLPVYFVPIIRKHLEYDNTEGTEFKLGLLFVCLLSCLLIFTIWVKEKLLWLNGWLTGWFRVFEIGAHVGQIRE